MEIAMSALDRGFHRWYTLAQNESQTNRLVPTGRSTMRRDGVDYKDAQDLASNLSKSDVDKYASEAAELLKLRPGGDLGKVVRALGGRIHFENPFFSDFEEGTIFVHGPDDFDIVLSSLASERRDRFTIAHELGHYLLHSKLGKHPLVATRSGTGRSEWEANWFAAGLLMPASIFIDAVKSGASVALLADRFLVSAAAVEVRKKSLNLV